MQAPSSSGSRLQPLRQNPPGRAGFCVEPSWGACTSRIGSDIQHSRKRRKRATAGALMYSNAVSGAQRQDSALNWAPVEHGHLHRNRSELAGIPHRETSRSKRTFSFVIFISAMCSVLAIGVFGFPDVLAPARPSQFSVLLVFAFGR